MSDLMKRAAALNYDHARRYVASRGWSASPSRREDLAIFRKADAEVVLPVDASLRDYSSAMLRFATTVAEIEERSVEAVVGDLGAAMLDRHRPALVGAGFETGAGLEETERMIEGATRALRSAACSANHRRAFHPRLSNSDADAFIAASRFAGTEQGSFVTVIETPTEVEGARPGFGREASEELLRSLQHLVSSLRRGTPEAVTDPAPEQPQVSANLCEAILQMAPVNEGADLRFSVSWSPLLALPKDVPAEVRVDRQLYEPIQQLATRMRPVTDIALRRYVGTVSELRGTLGPSGHVEGAVTLDILAEDRVIRARAVLDAASYLQAYQAHGSGAPVTVMAELHRARRSYELRNIQSLHAAL